MDPIIVLIIVIVGAVVFTALVYVGMKEDKGQDPLQERLLQFSERDELPSSLEEIELSLGFRDRILLPVVKSLARTTAKFTPQKQLEETRHRLEVAGMTMEPAAFFAMRIALTVLLLVLAFFIFFINSPSTAPGTALLYTLGAAGLGYMLPNMWLSSKIKRRQDNIWKALPDALDLLTICVEAGLGFDMAMGKVYEKWDNELAVAFGRVLREIQLGKLRRESLRDMANRMDVPDITAFVAAIIQADQLGVSMSKLLRVQSDQMRVKRRQRAQEKAHQAPVKMMIPMVFLIFPSIWVVLLGPAGIILFNSKEIGSTF
ncbi:MAG: type II secretion system F family protein [Chloroflexota bacterium]|mgnify:CR=1 FL=1|nr:type II secretion system F family protein [Chloroflexota bacterium]